MSLAPIQVTVSPHVSEGEDLLKIIWNYPPDPPVAPYFVSVKTLREKGENARNALQRLVNQAMKENSSGYVKELHELAIAGHELYEALFHEIKGSKASRIKAWLDRERANQQHKDLQFQITFVLETLLHIPWGLIYDGFIDDFTRTADKDFTEHKENFWSLRFLVSCVYRRIQPQFLNHNDGKDVLLVINKPVFDNAVPQLVLPQDEVLRWLGDTFGSPLTSSDDFFERWKTSGATCRLLFFYCHGSHESLELHTEDRITLTDFQLRTSLPDAAPQSTCLVFLNGCSTAAGSDKGTFLTVTSEGLFCGFVGTETKVPDIFALRFGLAFLYYFLHEGWPILKTMDHLRRRHWPLGLVYSSFCSPLLHFVPNGQHLTIDITDNFSQLPLGTKRI